MPLAFLEPPRVLVDLRASGLIGGLAHSPTLSARPERAFIDVGAGIDVGAAPVDAAVTAVFRVDAIEAPPGMTPSDRSRILENLRSPKVLDAARFPLVAFDGRYRGGIDGGLLTGTLAVRGMPKSISMTVRTARATREDDAVLASCEWEGELTGLGVQPFRTLLGALKLENWVRLRVDARFRQ